MTQQTAAPGNQDWIITLACLAFAALVVIGIVSMITVSARHDSRNRDYVNSAPWTRECRQELQAMTYPSLKEGAIAQNCRHIAQHGGTSRMYDKIASRTKPGTERDLLESYLYREHPIPGCDPDRGKCEAPPG